MPTAVPMETADGWMVVSKMRSPGSVVPPYRYEYNYEYFRLLADAEDRAAEIEGDEWRDWSFVALTPCRDGVPLGAKRIV